MAKLSFVENNYTHHVSKQQQNNIINNNIVADIKTNIHSLEKIISE